MPSTRWISDAWMRIRNVVTRRRGEQELAAELQFHIDMQTEENIRGGMSPDEARRQALVLFGGVEGHREASRDLRRLRPLENLLADARFGVRYFRRTPLTTATILLVLVLGLGVNAALFSAVQSATTLPPAGVARDASIVRIRGMHTGDRFGTIPRAMTESEVQEYSDRGELFQAVSAWNESSAVLEPRTPDQWPEPVRAVYVTGDYFGVLGIAPALGGPLPGVAGAGQGTAPLAAVISHRIWDQHFGRDPNAVGRTLRLNGFPVEVAGVAPAGFEGDGPPRGPSVWLPLSARRILEPTPNQDGKLDPAIFTVAARLREGVTLSRAIPTVAAIGARAPIRTFGDDVMQASSDIVPLRRDNATPGAEQRLARVAALFGAITMLILLITCTNVGGLLIGGAMRRRREIAVRLSLGASRGRIVRQLLTESVLLSISAAALVLLLLKLLAGSIRHRFPEIDFVLDWRTLLFAAGLALITAVGFGLSPALHATRIAVGNVLKDAAATVSSPRSWLHRALIVVQVALTQPLLVGLGAVVFLAGGDLASRPSRPVYDRIAAMNFSIVGGSSSIAAWREETERIAERLRSTAGVVAVSLSYGGYSPMEVTVRGEDRVATADPPAALRLRTFRAAPGYLDVMQLPIVRGRAFLPMDWESEAWEVVIGADLARTLWGEADPIGRRLRWAGTAGDSSDYTVVGVVDDRVASMAESGQPSILLAANGWTNGLLVRTAAPAEGMIPTLRAVASAAAPDSPVTEATTLAAQEAAARSFLLQMSGSASAGGLLALLLSAIGLYGLVATTVQQRTREIGVRVALGAGPQQVARHFFAAGLRLTAVGLAIGLPLALIALRLFALQVGLPEISTAMLAALIAAGTLGVAALAAWIPARRAARADPLDSLRSD